MLAPPIRMNSRQKRLAVVGAVLMCVIIISIVIGNKSHQCQLVDRIQVHSNTNLIAFEDHKSLFSISAYLEFAYHHWSKCLPSEVDLISSNAEPDFSIGSFCSDLTLNMRIGRSGSIFEVSISVHQRNESAPMHGYLRAGRQKLSLQQARLRLHWRGTFTLSQTCHHYS